MYYITLFHRVIKLAYKKLLCNTPTGDFYTTLVLKRKITTIVTDNYPAIIIQS
jgi:hypothetical protein